MKRNDLQIGKTYAHSRSSEPSMLYEITEFLVESTEPNKSHPQDVVGRFVKKDGTISDRTTVSLRRLIGDYKTVRHQLEIIEKNEEIRRLRREVEFEKSKQALSEYKEVFVKNYDIADYKIERNYNGTIGMTLSAFEFSRIGQSLANLKGIMERAN